MDERVRAIAARNGNSTSEVKVSFVEPRSSNGATANGNAYSNGNGNGKAHATPRKARVRKQDVAAAAARFPDGFTLAQVAAAVGCSPGAAKQHAIALAADGVLTKTGDTRENGAAVWKLRNGGSESAEEAGQREAGTGPGDDHAPNPVTVCLSTPGPQKGSFRFPRLSRRPTSKRRCEMSRSKGF